MLCNVHVFTWIRSTSINYALKPSCSGRNLMPFGGMIQNNNRSVSQYTGYVSCNEEQLMIRQSSAIDVISAICSHSSSILFQHRAAAPRSTTVVVINPDSKGHLGFSHAYGSTYTTTVYVQGHPFQV
ncbi:hypothetical protein AcV7_006588 [Taiwanofungus camphoratus]|nr:hypothetical protein AcV7_006588 [Antrodia cinnamomea]